MSCCCFQYDIGKGISDGVFRKQRYFTCAPNCAAFVALHRIRKCSKPLPTEEAVELVGATNFTNKWNLKIKDRVVWYSDDGPEYGTVKWIGLLPDTRSNEDVTVGVEFVSFHDIHQSMKITRIIKTSLTFSLISESENGFYNHHKNRTACE